VGKAYLNGRVGKIVGPVDSSSGYPVDMLTPWMDIDGPDKKKINYRTLNITYITINQISTILVRCQQVQREDVEARIHSDAVADDFHDVIDG